MVLNAVQLGIYIFGKTKVLPRIRTIALNLLKQYSTKLTGARLQAIHWTRLQAKTR